MASSDLQMSIWFEFSNRLQVPSMTLMQVPNFQTDWGLDFQTDCRDDNYEQEQDINKPKISQV